MTLSLEWRALQREAQLAGQQVATGITALGRANHARTGLYSQAFFGLSIGLERMGKLIIVAEHAVQNNGTFPANAVLRKYSHNLEQLLSRCEMIGATFHSERAHGSRPTDPIHQGIVETLSDFATQSRYYNLNSIAGSVGEQSDPITIWWAKVASLSVTRTSQERRVEKPSPMPL